MGEDPPLDEEEYARWRTEADRALLGARLQADAGLDNWACFCPSAPPTASPSYPSGVQAVCLTPSELGDAIRRGNRLVEEALADGVWVLGERFLSEAAGQAPRPAGVR
jgi:hypothetical protein